MKIISAKISNILSIEDAYIEFDDNGLMLVQGWNHDVARANGAGKSAIFNAITFALYDKLPRKITATEILRRDTKVGSVEILVGIGDKTYKVIRSRPKGIVYYEAPDYSNPVALTQQEWESKLGLNYTQYMVSMYCSQGTSTRFLSLNDSDKKQFLLQLLDLEEFSNCKSTADKKIKLFEQQVNEMDINLQSITSKKDVYSESLIDEGETNDLIKNGQIESNQLIEKINEYGLVNKPDLSKYSKIEDDIETKRIELTKAKTRLEMLHDQYRKINSKIHLFDESSTCLSCGTKLDTTVARTTHEREMNEHTIEINTLKTEIEACDSTVLKENQLLELVKKLKDRKREESSVYESACKNANDLRVVLSNKQLNVKNLLIKLQNNSELQNKINALTAMYEKVATKKINLLQEIELYRTVSSLYSSTGAQAYILDSIIDSLNEHMNKYVNILWPNLTYEITSHKENVKGEVTAKFSERLAIDSKDISIGSLSGGEFRALSLCVDFALIDVLERQFGINMSPIVLDEVFDGLDASGKELMIELLHKLADNRQVIVIDHASELSSSFSKVLMVDKKQGISTVNLQT